MKNKKYFIGALACSSLIIGSLFKIMHWSGASIIITISILLLILVFFPLAILSAYKADGRRKKVLYFAAFITIFLNFLGGLFKIMHWPGGSVLVFIAILVPLLIFLPVYLYFHVKEKEESLSNFLYIIFFLVCLSAMSGFLSLDISQEVLKDITRINEAASLTEYHKVKTEQYSQHNKDTHIDDILNKTDKLLQKIHDIKLDLIRQTWEENEVAITENNEIRTLNIPDKYTKGAGYEILVDYGRGNDLEESIRHYHDFLLSMPEIGTNTSLYNVQSIHGLLREHQSELSWMGDYAGVPLMLVLLKLTEVENSIRLAELEVLSTLKEKSPVSSDPDA